MATLNTDIIQGKLLDTLIRCNAMGLFDRVNEKGEIDQVEYHMLYDDIKLLMDNITEKDANQRQIEFGIQERI